LDAISPVSVLKRNGRRLIPYFQEVIVMLSLKEKRKLHFGALCFNDALHFLAGIPYGHIAATGSRGTAWRRGSDRFQQIPRFLAEA
jgi:hypothetical protein